MEGIKPKKVFPEGAVALDEAIILCGLDWCWRPVHSKGYCRRHYDVALEGKPFLDDPSRRVAAKPRCSFDPCDEPSIAKGLCSTHYNQQNQGRPLTVVKKRYVKHTDFKRPGQRLCGDCGQWKETVENFYKTTHGGYQNRCKPCMIRYNAAWNLKRKLKQKGVEVG